MGNGKALLLATFRTPFRPCDAAAPCCAGTARACWTFSLVGALPSTLSAAPGACPVALFDGFIGTMAPSDSPLLCMPDVRLSPSPAGLRLSLTVGDGVSRFSCIQFRGVPGVSDYVGPLSGSRSYAVTACCLPLQTTGSATSVCGFRSSIPCPSLPLSMLRTRTSRCAPQDSGSGWIRCSFPVGLFHSLLHAGLSRRSVCPTWQKNVQYETSFPDFPDNASVKRGRGIQAVSASRQSAGIRRECGRVQFPARQAIPEEASGNPVPEPPRVWKAWCPANR